MLQRVRESKFPWLNVNLVDKEGKLFNGTLCAALSLSVSLCGSLTSDAPGELRYKSCSTIGEQLLREPSFGRSSPNSDRIGPLAGQV